MVIRCNGCGGAMKWRPDLQKLKCRFCETVCEPHEIPVDEHEGALMECNIFSCTACGAELAVNDTEAATFCAYCGQPSIVFERVSKIRRPRKIIPFRLTREQAEQAVRDGFKKGSYVPKEIKNFTVERLNGIYVPYRVYDFTYSAKQEVSVKRKKENPRVFHCDNSADFKNVLEDASKNFCNESAHCLEPFDFKEEKDFHEGYLSGFYADQYDENENTTEQRALERCKKMFDDEIVRTFPKEGTKTIVRSEAKPSFSRAEYVLLPVWFLTLRYKNKPYTILVNGQSGKVTGSVPKQNVKSVLTFIAFLLLGLLVFPAFYTWLFNLETPADGESGLLIIMFRAALLMIPLLMFFSIGKNMIKRMKKNVKRTTDKNMTKYSSDRRKEEE